MRHFSTRFNATSMKFDTEFRSLVKVIVGADEIEHYKGSYEVTPSVESQEMLTKNKMMDKDVTIKAIPYAEVSNTSGGCTISIG